MGRRFTNLNHVRSWAMNIAAAGTAEQLTVKQTGTTIGFNAKAFAVKDPSGSTVMLDTITDSAKGFLTAGFQSGDQITVVDTGGANGGSYVIYDISADGGTIYITGSGKLTTEAAGNSVKIVAPVTIPEGISLTLHAKKANTQKIYVGFNALNVQGHQVFTLSPGDVVGLQLRSSDTLWLDADVTAEGVEAIVEQNKQGVQ